MPAITATSGRSASLKQQIESFFQTHNVTAEKLKNRYGEDSESADWGVVCDDCGRKQSFFLTPTDGEVNVSDVFIDSLENEPCEPYKLADVDTGNHNLVVHDADPRRTGNRRVCHCDDCGRTTKLPANDEYADKELETFGDRPCTNTYTTKELGSAVIYSSIPRTPNRETIGIENWSYSGSNGWGRNINGFWSHPNFPVTVVLTKRFGERAIKMNVVKGGLSRPGDMRSETITVTQYQASKDDDVNFDVLQRVLRFMQAVNDYDSDAEDFEEIRDVIDTDIISHYADSHELQREVPDFTEK